MTPAAALLAALHCLSMNVYYEARGEPYIGQVAVAQVTLRRAGNNPAAVCREVYRPGQFSWTAWRHRKPHMLDPAWRRAQNAAAEALRWGLGEWFPDHSRGATHFHATWIEPPAWAEAYRVTTRIGQHIFYRR
jgi:spore germination cell wall hydrolase CwlJ-like protein